MKSRALQNYLSTSNNKLMKPYISSFYFFRIIKNNFIEKFVKLGYRTGSLYEAIQRPSELLYTYNPTKICTLDV